MLEVRVLVIDSAICNATGWSSASSRRRTRVTSLPLIDGEATVKSYRQRDGHVWLMPANRRSTRSRATGHHQAASCGPPPRVRPASHPPASAPPAATARRAGPRPSTAPSRGDPGTSGSIGVRREPSAQLVRWRPLAVRGAVSDRRGSPRSQVVEVPAAALRVGVAVHATGREPPASADHHHIPPAGRRLPAGRRSRTALHRTGAVAAAVPLRVLRGPPYTPPPDDRRRPDHRSGRRPSRDGPPLLSPAGAGACGHPAVDAPRLTPGPGRPAG